MVFRKLKTAKKKSLTTGGIFVLLMFFGAPVFAAELMGGPQLPGIANGTGPCYDSGTCPVVCSPNGLTTNSISPSNPQTQNYVTSTLACAQPAAPAVPPAMPTIPMPSFGGGAPAQQQQNNGGTVTNNVTTTTDSGGSTTPSGPLTPATGTVENSNDKITPQIQKLLDAAKKVKGQPSGGNCGIGVRQAFEAAYAPAQVQRTNLARDYGPSYEKPPFNYKKCSGSQYTEFNAPAGSIIIYTNSFRPSAAGHIEIKGTDGYYSDFYEDHPISTKGTRKVEEILVPPGDSKC
jgi:hypothetical protein